MNVEKPLTRFISEHYNEDFSEVIKDAMEFDGEMHCNDMKLLLEKAYWEGFLDGSRMIFAAIEF